MPTLGSLRVTNAADTAQAATESFSSTKTEYTYKILDSEQKLKIYPTATVSGLLSRSTETSWPQTAARP